MQYREHYTVGWADLLVQLLVATLMHDDLLSRVQKTSLCLAVSFAQFLRCSLRGSIDKRREALARIDEYGGTAAEVRVS